MMRKHLKDQTGERLCSTLTTLENERESRLRSSPPSRGSKTRTLPSPTPPGWAFVGRCIIDIKPWLLSNPVINHQNQNGALLFQESHQSKLPTYKRTKEQRPKTAWFAKKNQNICLCLMIGNRWILVDKWLLLKKGHQLIQRIESDGGAMVDNPSLLWSDVLLNGWKSWTGFGTITIVKSSAHWPFSFLFLLQFFAWLWSEDL